MNKLLLIFITFILTACGAMGSDEPELKDGRCRYNSDCPEGFTCRDTFCEDIHHPRADIKPF